MSDFSVQTRSETSGICIHVSLEKAMEAAKEDDSIWKISFQLPTGEMVRLVKQDNVFVYEPVV